MLAVDAYLDKTSNFIVRFVSEAFQQCHDKVPHLLTSTLVEHK